MMPAIESNQKVKPVIVKYFWGFHLWLLTFSVLICHLSEPCISLQCQLNFIYGHNLYVNVFLKSSPR